MDNPLTGVLPPKVRKVAYAVLFVGAQAVAIWQVSDGDWTKFVGAEATALLGLLAASNVTDPEPPRP
jgi:hypothetical protein